MRVLSLQSAGVNSGIAVFAVGLEADDGSRHALWVDGRALEHPVTFADHAGDKLGKPCSSNFVGDAGGWQAHLGDLLRQSGGTAPLASNVTFSAAPVGNDPDRRTALLSRTALGQATLAAERAAALAANAPQPAVEARVETFSEQCRRESEECDRARRAEMSNYFKLTHLGRDVLAADRAKSGK